MCRKASHHRRGDVQPIVIPTTITNNKNFPPAYTPAETGTISTPPRDVSLAQLEKDMNDAHLYPADNKQPLYNEAELDVLSNPGDLPSYLQPPTQTQQAQPITSARNADFAPGSPIDVLITAGRHVAAHHQQRHHGCCRHNKRNLNLNTNPTMIPASAYEAANPQRDLQAFSTAMVAVRAGNCCAKGKAKRAVHQLKRDLVHGVDGHRELDRAGRKQLKAEAREVVSVFKREIKEAWRMRG